MIYEYMDSKATEYTPFNPQRARDIFSQLQLYLTLKSYNIHIIGTNGKGSTGRFIAQSIYEANHSVLHFTSPHIFDFKERFYLNNHIVSDEELESAHDFLQQFDFMQDASYFEYATFLALVLGQQCDYLIMEAGVGGEYDSTSVLHYHITIFTRIGIDHKELLGDSLQAIAMTKLKAAQGVIFTHFQEKEVLKLLRNLHLIVTRNMSLESISSQKHGFNTFKIYFLSQQDICKKALQEYAQKYHLPYFLQENLALSNLVLEYLQIPLLTQKLDLRGRFEILQDNLILDVGHNEMAAKSTLLETKKYFHNEKFILIYNSYKEKEINKILHIFKNDIEKVIIFAVNNPRIIPQKHLQDVLTTLQIPFAFFNPNIKKQLDELPKNLIKYRDDFLESEKKYLVFGSFSLIESFLQWYNSSKFKNKN